jgi:hypothetical protein
VQCRKVAKTVLDKLAGTLENLDKSIQSKGLGSKEDQKACKVEIVQTQEMLEEARTQEMPEEARKMHDEAVVKMYELLRNLLSSHPQTLWDWICCGMHERDSWAGGNGQMTTGRCPHSRTAFETVLSCICSQTSLLMRTKGSGTTFSRWCASPRGPLRISIFLIWEC